MRKPLASGPLCTRASLAADFRSVGISPGCILLVHSSLSRLGFVCGGAEAVILALLDTLGPEGTLVVPTFSGENSDPAFWSNPPVPSEWWPEIRASYPAYDPRTTRTRSVGVIPETMRTWPGVVRSAHPQTSFAAIGRQARAILDGHALDCMLGEQSPLARLEEHGANVLLLGVGWSICTAFHLAEHRTPDPPLEHNAFAYMTEDGRKWVTLPEVVAINGDKFGEMGESFESQGLVVLGKVGGANVKLFRLGDAVKYAESWLPVHRPRKIESEKS